VISKNINSLVSCFTAKTTSHPAHTSKPGKVSTVPYANRINSSIGLSLLTKHCAFLWTVSAIGKAYAPVRYSDKCTFCGV
jgi:hypothetical protein